MRSTIATRSGKRFDIQRPRPCDVEIDDIAIALSRVARYTGHTKDFLSVAQHSVNVSRLLNEWGESLEVQVYGLLHDASEAYLNDVVRPLKRLRKMAHYRTLERRVMKVILKGLKLKTKLCLNKRQLKTVKLADDCVALAERRDQLNVAGSPIRKFVEPGSKPWDQRIVGMEWRDAYYMFLATYKSLVERL